MFCPECGDEYREGFTVCATCHVPLVNSPPDQEAEIINLVTVYETNNPGMVANIKSVLELEGIRYSCTGEDSLHGSVHFQVDQKDVKRAKEVLQNTDEDLFEASQTQEEESDTKEIYKPIYNPINEESNFGGLLTGILIGMLLSGIVFFIYQYRQKHLSGVVGYDHNKDNKPDLICHYKDGKIIKSEEDRNFDGKIDAWFFYKNNLIEHAALDNNFDRTVDAWEYFKDRMLVRYEIDTNSDNKPEMVDYYKDGVISEEVWYYGDPRTAWKKITFFNGVKEEEYVDQDYNGTFDLKTVYDAFGRPIRTVKAKGLQ